MSLDNPKGIESSVSKNTKQRRTFLKRATAGAVIASIPGRSAWAGIAGSIVASGHGSDWNDGECTQLLSGGYWKNDQHLTYWAVPTTTTFFDAFGGEPILPNDTTPSKTLLEVLQNSGNGTTGLGGPSNVNFHMVAMYLTAAYFEQNPAPNTLRVFYPAVEQHGSLGAYASYLYGEALADPSGVGELLKTTIFDYDEGNFSRCP
jgi:hypothetical protein